MRRSQSEAGKERKPEESSITSNLSLYISVGMLFTRESWKKEKGGRGPKIFAFEKIFFKDGFGVGVSKEVLGPSALLWSIRLAYIGKHVLEYQGHTVETYTPCSCARSISSRSCFSGKRENEPDHQSA